MLPQPASPIVSVLHSNHMGLILKPKLFIQRDFFLAPPIPFCKVEGRHEQALEGGAPRPWWGGEGAGWGHYTSCVLNQGTQPMVNGD